MAVERKFQAVVTVLDRTAGPLRSIQARLAGMGTAGASVGRGLQAAAERLSAIGNSNAMARLGALATRAGNGIAHINAGLGRLQALGALAAGGIVAGMLGMSRASVDSAGRLADLSAQTGMTVEQLTGLQHAGRLSSVPLEDMVGALSRLSVGMREVSTGRNANLAELFQRLRVPLRDAQGDLRSTADVFTDLADRFQQEGPHLREQMARALFGRGGAPLLRLLGGGSEALRETMAEGLRLNPQINSNNIDELDKLGDAFEKVKTAVEGMRDAIVVRLGPQLAPMLENLAKWIAANQDIVGNDVAGWIKGVADRIAGWNIGAFIESMKSVAETVGKIVEAFGGLETILVGSVILRLAGIIAAIGAALLGLPVAAITAVAATIGAAGYLIWRNWDGLVEMFDNIAAAMRRAGDAMRESFRQGPGGVPGLPGGALPTFPAVPGIPGGAPNGLIPGLPAFPGFPGLDGGPGFPRGPSLLAPRRMSSTQPEGRLVVEFANLPRGASVRQERADPGLPDITLAVGYSSPFAA
jgi:hypothetical protein